MGAPLGSVSLFTSITRPPRPSIPGCSRPCCRISSEKFGNAASRSHSFGWEAEKAVDFARKRIAALAGATPREIVFTSGATESNNLAIKGVGGLPHRDHGDRAQSGPGPGQTSGQSGRCGPPYSRPGRMAWWISTNCERHSAGHFLVSIMFANNEIGVIQPVRGNRRDLPRTRASYSIATRPRHSARSRRVTPDHYRPDVVSAHKMYGPKGIGALYVRRRIPSRRKWTAAATSSGMRSGTLNVPGDRRFRGGLRHRRPGDGAGSRPASRPARPPEGRPSPSSRASMSTDRSSTGCRATST